MSINKTTFQNDLKELESMLEMFKNSFPKNYGSMFRKNLAYFMMLLGVFMFFDSFGGGEFITVGPCCMSPVILLFGIVLWNKTIETYDTTKYKHSNISNAIVRYENTYKDYPDVSDYLKRYKSAFKTELRKKRTTKWVFRLCFWGIFVLYGCKILGDYNDSSSDTLRNVSTSDNICQALKLDKYTPFAVLTPLKTDITDSIRLESPSLGLYAHYYEGDTIYVDDEKSADYRALSAATPEISGCKSGDRFRLTITDENGKPVDGCPDFVFDAGKSDKIYSNNFSVYAYSVRYKLQCLQILAYIRNNQQNLRFLVEKIND